jgi:hypothetical protein
MTHDNTNRGAIWKNDDKREDRHPDFKGSINVDGREYWVSAWKRKEGASAKSPALSFSIKPKEEKKDEQSISQRAMPKGRSIIPDDDMDGDGIPF